MEAFLLECNQRFKLDLNEEMDLLIKCLGNKSAEHARHIRAIHIDQQK